uniref:Si:ch211-193l2.10 n=1 Tax=Acanthochromis polyacanthus TaxID=80966 RepID=A0A3Q1F8X7_9TELE
MRGLLTTQSQNCYREQIQKEMLTRLAWKSRYAKLYPTCSRNNEASQLPQLPASPRSADPLSSFKAPPLMRPVSPQTRRALFSDSSHHGKGRHLYLQKRGHIRPEEKFEFPLLSSWEYGWRLGDYTLDYRTPSCARSSVVKDTFYARNGVFSSPSATDTLG